MTRGATTPQGKSAATQRAEAVLAWGFVASSVESPQIHSFARASPQAKTALGKLYPIPRSGQYTNNGYHQVLTRTLYPDSTHSYQDSWTYEPDGSYHDGRLWTFTSAAGLTRSYSYGAPYIGARNGLAAKHLNDSA